MTRREAVEILNDLECHYPVEQWSMDEIAIWPLVKMDLFFKWFGQHYSKETAKFEKNSFAKKVKQRVYSFINLGRLWLMPRQKTAILFSGASSHRVDLGGNFINRFYQPIIEYLQDEQNKEVVIVDYLPKSANKKYQPSANLFFLDDYRFAAKLIYQFKKSNQNHLPRFIEFLQQAGERLELQLNPVNNYISYLKKTVRDVRSMSSVYKLFLRKFRPKMVMGLCYYGGPMYAMNYASKQLGIPSIDMQHGGQGELHAAYAGFAKLPFHGYNIMPTYFWCWDDASAGVIKNWAEKQCYHQVVVGGNPWLTYRGRYKGDYQFPDKRIILYTMQFNELEPYLVEAIQNTPEDYVWWLRLHPRKLDGLPELIAKLRENRILNKVELEKASSYPLPAILSKAHVHLSKYSGSVIEAAEMGVKTILLDPIGIATYPKQLLEGSAIALPVVSASGLIEAIQQIRNNNQVINENEPLFKSILQKLLN